MLKILILGSGELGKEVVIELKRYGAYVVAADRYFGAPAQQVADEYRTLDMLDAASLHALILEVQPDLIVPEIEAIATHAFTKELLLEAGAKVVPSRKAVSLTMDREGIRKLAAKGLGLPTSPYGFASSVDELVAAATAIGFPVVVKPVQSSSGKGQSVAQNSSELEAAWQTAQNDARGGSGANAGRVNRCIVEGFVRFDYEITLLTCVAENGITFCEPIAHVQVDGDYRTSTQPMLMSAQALEQAQRYAKSVVEALVQGEGFDNAVDAGYGIFGVEFFIKGDEAIFSEVSPRPHDTGMVTMLSQNVSEFAMHARAILGLPVFNPTVTPGASRALLAKGHGAVRVQGLTKALEVPQSEVRIFGKPEVQGERRVGVALALGKDVSDAVARVDAMEQAIRFEVGNE